MGPYGARAGAARLDIAAAVENDAAVAIGQHQNGVVIELAKIAVGDPTEGLEIAAAQRIGLRQHLQGGGDALGFGVQHRARRTHRRQHPVMRGIAPLDIIEIHDRGGECDQRQGGAGDKAADTPR